MGINPNDITPILPFSVWYFDHYGIVVVIDSLVVSDDIWAVTFSDHTKTHHNIQIKYTDWLKKATYKGELFTSI